MFRLSSDINVLSEISFAAMLAWMHLSKMQQISNSKAFHVNFIISMHLPIAHLLYFIFVITIIHQILNKYKTNRNRTNHIMNIILLCITRQIQTFLVSIQQPETRITVWLPGWRSYKANSGYWSS